jgi:hypothetical protein
MDLPQTQKAARTASCPKMSSNRAVVSSIGFGPSSKDNKISPEEMQTVSIDCQIVHCWRNLWMKEFKEFRSSGVQEFRSSGVQEFRSSGVQEFRSSGVQEFRVGSWLVLQVKNSARSRIAQLRRPCLGPWRLEVLELLQLSPRGPPPYHCLFEPLVPMMGRLSENGVLARVITSSMWLVFPRLVALKSF